ncbi:IclR family transcriptional regulator C-terminal domain-containing protein [Microbacterium sp. QXD-8]|uniref:IclR family transcriptional regulator C-terminal domain-containing protein n=1 Tax=Microbacterium psychrotolerans TaxID=3068321 RepID=A0ABU0Z1P1_9MICO|nr:IclR family transcriptional regulator C-terminal domain-containing protein [Microbacterium sp. QXD-8]MDQ7878496.1 IclR family transcriptional regulator C-terminal domain-containing protein [Microbacterium sp. QXD-8]
MSAPSSLLQGLALLDAAVAQERSGRQGHNASRLAETTGIERSRVSRLTRELRELGYLDRDNAAVLKAGDGYFRAAAALSRPWLRAARESLRVLASTLGVSAQLVAAEGPGAILLRSEKGPGVSADYLRPGILTPIWCTGPGRALLWEHTRDDLEALLADVQFVGVGGPGAARSVDQLHQLLERDRKLGMVDAREEYVEGVRDFALPIRDQRGIVVSIGISSGGLWERRTREAQSALRDACARLSQLIQES